MGAERQMEPTMGDAQSHSLGSVKQIGRGGWQARESGLRTPLSKVIAGTEGLSLASWTHQEAEAGAARPPRDEP